MAGEKDFIVKNSLQIGGGDLVISKDSDGDLEVKNSSGTLKKLKVDEIELGTGSDVVVLKRNSSGNFESKTKNKSTKTETANVMDLGDNDTDDLSEGSTNLYYTNARVDTHLNSSTASSGEYLSWNGSDYDWASVPAGYADSDVLSYLSGGTYAGHIIPSADVTYDLGSLSKQWRDVYVGPGSLYVNGQKVLEDSSGTIVVSADSDQNLQMKTAGSGDIEFNPSGTGIIQAKGTLQMLDGELITNSAGNAVAFGNNITVDQIASRSADTNLVLSGNGTGNVTLNDSVVITGDLTVSGTTTTVNSETINLADNILNLNSDFTSGSPTQDAGLSISRGGSAAKTFLWDETNDRWTVGSESMVAGTFIGDLTGDVTGNADSATTLTGLTSTVAELNYSDGVTSNIQTQLDAKYGSGSNATLGTITTSNASNSGGYVRNIYQSTSTPGSGDGAVGDLWIYYS